MLSTKNSQFESLRKELQGKNTILVEKQSQIDSMMKNSDLLKNENLKLTNQLSKEQSNESISQFMDETSTKNN